LEKSFYKITTYKTFKYVKGIVYPKFTFFSSYTHSHDFPKIYFFGPMTVYMSYLVINVPVSTFLDRNVVPGSTKYVM